MPRLAQACWKRLPCDACAGCANDASRGNETTIRGGAAGSLVRTLASGSRIAVARAATQTACRWRAGPCAHQPADQRRDGCRQRNLPEGIEQESK